MKTKKYKGKVIRYLPKQKLVEICTPEGETVLFHKNEILRPNPYLGEMSWEELIIAKGNASFWALDVPIYPNGIQKPILDYNKTEYWSAQQVFLPAEAAEHFSFSGEAARSTFKNVAAKIMPQLDDIDAGIRSAITMGRYDLAYGIARLTYSGIAHNMKAEDIQFKGSPGSYGLLLRMHHNKKMNRIVQVPGFAGSVIYTWWALHGGWHHKGTLWEPFDMRKALSSTSNPFLVAGKMPYRYADLHVLNEKTGSLVTRSAGMRLEHIGPINKYYTVDGVVYVKNGPSYVPMGLAHPDLPPITPSASKHRAWDEEWIKEETEKLHLPLKMKNYFIGLARKNALRIENDLEQ